MIVETVCLALCIYGLMKCDHVVKVAALISCMSFPAVMMFARAGAPDLVLLVLAIEAVPLAFALLLLRVLDQKNYRRLWEHA
jgi:glycerol-3-phosphate acyltransferase PlsY